MSVKTWTYAEKIYSCLKYKASELTVQMCGKHLPKVYLHLIHRKHSYPAAMKYYLFVEYQHNL